MRYQAAICAWWPFVASGTSGFVGILAKDSDGRIDMLNGGKAAETTGRGRASPWCLLLKTAEVAMLRVENTGFWPEASFHVPWLRRTAKHPDFWIKLDFTVSLKIITLSNEFKLEVSR